MNKNISLRFLRGMWMAALLLIGGVAFAQTAVTGNVVDAASGEPIIGASVLEVGTTNGTITDFDGNFNLKVSAGATLSISYMGYKTQTLAVGNQTVFKVRLGEDSELLDEVVVVGYGVVKKGDATGSVTAIKPDDMNKGLVTNAQDMMTGKIAGVQVTSDGGAPGAGATIRIRGGSSLSASNSPLIVIDGLAMDNNGIKGVSNPLSMVNPNDIETFTVLKDASATAIYGSRASNGVIIITTKKGKQGSKPKFSYEGNVSANILVNRLETMNATEYTNYIKKTQPALADGLGSANTNWQDEIYRTAIATDHNFNVMGGTKHMPYRASLGYTYQDGTLRTSQMQRATASLNLNPSFLDDHLTFNLNAKGMYIYNRYAEGGAVGSALVYDPTRPVRVDPFLNDTTENPAYHKEYGGYYQTPYLADQSALMDSTWNYVQNGNVPQNPVAQLMNHKDQAHSGSFVGNLEVDYKIHGLEDLRLHANFGADYSYGKQTTVDNVYSYNGNNYYGWDGYNEQTKYNLQFNCYAQYYKDFNENHHFDIMAGYEWQHFKNWGSNGGNGLYQMTNTGFLDKDKTMPKAGEKYNVNFYEYATENYLVSFFGRVNYIALNRYMITATVRGDGSSRFAKGNQWGVFPSVALGWKIKEEAFLKDVNWLSDLKLRLGYGITGQQDLNNGDYPGLLLYELSREGASYTLGEIDPVTGQYIYYQTARPNAYNPDLTWEKTTTYNAGLDFGFLNSRITASVDYYYRQTKDMISMVDVPIGTNFRNQVLSNIGSLSNQGVEVMLNAVAIDRKHLKWDLGFNFTYNQNKILHLSTGSNNADNPYYVTTGGISSGTGNTIQRHQEGYAANTFFVYQTYKTEKGTYEIYDQDKSGSINDKDLIPYHHAMPDFTMGLQSKWQFYGVDISISLRSSIGNYVYNDVKAGKMSGMATPAREGGYTNVLKSALPVYNAIVDSKTIKTDANAFMTDLFVENGSFLRIDNITVGYTFDKPKIMARIYATVQNPYLYSPYSGLDPEVFSGIDNNIYPRSMSALLGVSLQF